MLFGGYRRIAPEEPQFRDPLTTATSGCSHNYVLVHDCGFLTQALEIHLLLTGGLHMSLDAFSQLCSAAGRGYSWIDSGCQRPAECRPTAMELAQAHARFSRVSYNFKIVSFGPVRQRYRPCENSFNGATFGVVCFPQKVPTEGPGETSGQGA